MIAKTYPGEIYAPFGQLSQAHGKQATAKRHGGGSQRRCSARSERTPRRTDYITEMVRSGFSPLASGEDALTPSWVC